MAERYSRNSKSVKVYRYDTPFEAVFADGSKVIFDVFGRVESVIPPNHEVILMDKMNAEMRGITDRLSRLPMDSAYKYPSKIHLPAVAACYRNSWHSVPDWPKYVRKFR